MSITTDTDPVDTVLAILNDTGVGDWTNAVPEIYRYSETTTKGRENEANDAVYVLSLGGTSLDRFGVEPGTQDNQQEDGQVQVLCASLTEGNAQDMSQNVTNIIRDYMSDNYTSTNMHYLEPTDIVDSRAQKIARMTDHFVYLVEIETKRTTL
jgi:hypothetical protein